MELGQKIKINSCLERKQLYSDRNSIGFRDWLREWVEVPLKEEREVIVVDRRSLSNGRVDRDSEAGNLYTPKTYLSALLVVGNLREKPFYILNK